jgi:hypothetical protein
MKIERLIILSVCLVVSLNVVSQETETTAKYYEYELVPTGKIYNTLDTAYKLILILDIIEMSRYVELQFETENYRNVLKVLPSDLETLPEVSLKQDKYHIEVGEVQGAEAFKVSGKNGDGDLFELQTRGKAKMHVHQVISDQSNRRNLTFFEGVPIVEPIPIVEPKPVEPDTTGARTK